VNNKEANGVEEEILICKKCKIEYKEGEEVCSNCGGRLVPKEKPKEKFICPKCKILYESMKSCIKCGGPLVKQGFSQESEEPKPSEAPEAKKEESEAAEVPEVEKELPPIQPIPKPPTEVPRKEPKSLDTPEIKKEVRKEPPPSHPPEKQLAKKLLEDMGIGISFSKEAKKSFFQTPVGLLGIFVLVAVAIYVLFSVYSYFTKKVSEPTPSTPGETTQITPPGTSKPTDPTATVVEPPSPPATLKPAVGEKEEIEKIEGLLDKIRQANLKKDIDLFMSCYAKGFKDREERKRTALKFWGNYNYLELTYTLKGQSIIADTATAIVEWGMTYAPRSGGPSQKSNTVLNVIFKKEGEDWKIKEIIPVR
jgi:DNA-directed RNA polymerase subunit M/transcription elongation factor TFIIS